MRTICDTNIATVFWDDKRILLIDYLEKCTTIAREYYYVFTKLQKNPRWEKTRFAAEEKIIFYHDNAPAHKCFRNRKI